MLHTTITSPRQLLAALAQRPAGFAVNGVDIGPAIVLPQYALNNLATTRYGSLYARADALLGAIASGRIQAEIAAHNNGATA